MPSSKKKSPDPHPIEEITQTVRISLPLGNMPLPLKVIALLTSAGGLSIVASMFTDIVRPQQIIPHFYALRLIVGIGMILVGYGIVKGNRWTVWLYGAISIVSVSINPILAILPLLITIYLYFQKEYLGSSLIDRALEYIHNLFKRRKI